MIEKLFILDAQSADREIKDYSSSYEIGTLITWTNEGTNYQFGLNPLGNILATISPSKKEILVIHGTNKLKILNADSTIRFDLTPPIPISEQSKKVKTKDWDLRFLNFGEKISKTIVSVWIGLGWDWFEVRELDLTTGEFGALKLSGRL